IQQPTTDTLFALFANRLAAVGGQAHRFGDSDAAATAIQVIAGSERVAWISDGVGQRAPELIAALHRLGFDTRTPANPGEVRDQPLGLAIAEGAIAETGSSILVEPYVYSRSVTLMTEALVVVCPLAALLPSLDEAAGMLRTISAGGASYATFVTGPSRTADIERQLTVGVQGPSVFHVLLVDELT
ncbi:MAG: LUD domain-containing protein, partial [Thermomicrobiales bacterium]